MATAQDLLNNLRSIKRNSARKAVDYMEGNQLPHLKDYLDLDGYGIKDWRDRGVLPVFENVTGHVIDQSAKTYQQHPMREVLIRINGSWEVDEKASDIYNELLTDSNFDETAQHCDLLARLLKTSVILCQFDDEEKKLFFEAMSQDNCDITYDRKRRKADSLLYTGGSISASGNSIYHFWTPESVQTFELSDRVLSGGLYYSDSNVSNLNNNLNFGVLSRVSEERNTFGMIPIGVLYDTKPPRFGFWSDTVWDELIQFNLAVNMFHTEMKFNQRYGAIGALFSDADIEGVVGPDAVLKLIKEFEGETPYLAYESPDVQITQFLEWLNDFRESIGRNWGVNIKMRGDASADSGFKLIVEELPTLELRTKRLPSAETFEQQVYKSILAISKAKRLGLPENSKLRVTFPDPDLPVNKQEQWTIAKEEIALGLLSKEDYIREKYPTWTDKQIEEYLAKIQQEKSAAAPNFAAIVDEEEEMEENA